MTSIENTGRTLARGAVTAVAAAALVLVGTGGALAHPTGGGGGGPRPPDRTTSAGDPVDLGALFIGAHPDDEAGALSAYGQWGEENGLRTGVITVTRGEGGGNAVGPEEGPALGLLREKEERAAVAKAGITEVFNLDEVDFYYTVSDAADPAGLGPRPGPRQGRADHPADPARGALDDGPRAVAGQPRQPPGRRAAGHRGLRRRR